MVSQAVTLGDKVQDTITGNKGIAIARTEWMYGCIRITVQPEGSKDGVPLECFNIDEPQLKILKFVKKEEAPYRHGPKPTITKQTI